MLSVGGFNMLISLCKSCMSSRNGLRASNCFDTKTRWVQTIKVERFLSSFLNWARELTVKNVVFVWISFWASNLSITHSFARIQASAWSWKQHGAIDQSAVLNGYNQCAVTGWTELAVLESWGTFEISDYSNVILVLYRIRSQRD